MRDDIYIGRLGSLPATGAYKLDITARDPSGTTPEQTITVNVQVLVRTFFFFECKKLVTNINEKII